MSVWHLKWQLGVMAISAYFEQAVNKLAPCLGRAFSACLTKALRLFTLIPWPSGGSKVLTPIFKMVGQGVDKLTQLRDAREEGADLEAALLQALKLLQAGMALTEDHVWLLRELRCTSEPAVSCQRRHQQTCHAHKPYEL